MKNGSNNRLVPWWTKPRRTTTFKNVWRGKPPRRQNLKQVRILRRRSFKLIWQPLDLTRALHCLQRALHPNQRPPRPLREIRCRNRLWHRNHQLHRHRVCSRPNPLLNLLPADSHNHSRNHQREDRHLVNIFRREHTSEVFLYHRLSVLTMYQSIHSTSSLHLRDTLCR